MAQERPASGSSDVDNRDSASDCNSSEELNGDSCCVTRSIQTYEACSNGVVTTETWTGNGNPVDDDTATRTYCVGASARTATICGSSNQDDQPTTAECQNQGKVRNSAGCCAAVLTYEACSNGVVTTEPWTGSGNPVNDDTATRTYCVGSSVRTETICASSDDDDRPNSCGTGYSLNSVDCCEQDRTYEACSNGVVSTKPWTGSGNPVNDDTATRYYCVGASARTAPICGSTDRNDKPTSCSSGYSLNSGGCCAEDTVPQTYEACSNGVVTTEPWTGSGNPVNDDTATRTFCDGAVKDTEPICGSNDIDDRPNSCATGYSLNSVDCCEQDRTYQACSNGVLTTKPWTGNGNPVDDDTATRYYCVGASARTAPICGSTDRNDKPTSCSSGYSLNSGGCCAEIPTYEACSNGVVTTKPWTSNGNPVDDDTAIRTFCDGAVKDTEPICGSNDIDDRPNSCSSGYSLNGDRCCEEDPTRGIEYYCDAGVVKEREASGTADVYNLDSASDCTSRQLLNSDSCCVSRGTESYCDSNGVAQERLASRHGGREQS